MEYYSHSSNQPPPATSLCLKKSSKAPDFWLLIQLTLLITYHQHKWKMISDTEGISRELDLEWLKENFKKQSLSHIVCAQFGRMCENSWNDCMELKEEMWKSWGCVGKRRCGYMWRENEFSPKTCRWCEWDRYWKEIKYEIISKNIFFKKAVHTEVILSDCWSKVGSSADHPLLHQV